jgi:adenylylsulfate reductase subunit B
MSVSIDPKICLSCGRCAKVCPGALLEVPKNRSVRILYPADCWGCAACVKECPQGAIALCLPPALGGRGGRLVCRRRGEEAVWRLSWPDGSKLEVSASSQDPGEY